MANELDRKSEASERFLNERREHWRRIIEEERRAQKLEMKEQKEQAEAPNKLSKGEIICIVIGGLLIGALFASPLGPWAFAILGIFLLLKMGLN